jgi:hypothetical protein
MEGMDYEFTNIVAIIIIYKVSLPKMSMTFYIMIIIFIESYKYLLLI